MWRLPTHHNCIVQYQTGDYFRTALPHLLTDRHICITNKMLINTVYKPATAPCVTVHGLKKRLEKGMLPQTSIVIDTRLPRQGSIAFRTLQKAVTGKHIVLLHPPLSDIESMNCLQVLLALTKGKTVKVKKWSSYLYTQKTWH